MCSYLRKYFCCCIPDNQVDRQAPYIVNSLASISISDNQDNTIYFKVPRGKFSVFFEKDLSSRELDISGFMSLYKHSTEDLVLKPGPDYKYSKYVFRADEEYIKVEGWVPVDIFNVKPGNVGVLSKPFVESNPSAKNIISVDIRGNIAEDKKVVSVQDISVRTKAYSNTPARSGVSTYSRYVADI